MLGGMGLITEQNINDILFKYDVCAYVNSGCDNLLNLNKNNQEVEINIGSVEKEMKTGYQYKITPKKVPNNEVPNNVLKDIIVYFIDISGGSLRYFEKPTDEYPTVESDKIMPLANIEKIICLNNDERPTSRLKISGKYYLKSDYDISGFNTQNIITILKKTITHTSSGTIDGVEITYEKENNNSLWNSYKMTEKKMIRDSGETEQLIPVDERFGIESFKCVPDNLDPARPDDSYLFVTKEKILLRFATMIFVYLMKYYYDEAGRNNSSDIFAPFNQKNTQEYFVSHNLPHFARLGFYRDINTNKISTRYSTVDNSDTKKTADVQTARNMAEKLKQLMEIEQANYYKDNNSIILEGLENDILNCIRYFINSPHTDKIHGTDTKDGRIMIYKKIIIEMSKIYSNKQSFFSNAINSVKNKIWFDADGIVKDYFRHEYKKYLQIYKQSNSRINKIYSALIIIFFIYSSMNCASADPTVLIKPKCNVPMTISSMLIGYRAKILMSASAADADSSKKTPPNNFEMGIINKLMNVWKKNKENKNKTKNDKDMMNNIVLKINSGMSQATNVLNFMMISMNPTERIIFHTFMHSFALALVKPIHLANGTIQIMVNELCNVLDKNTVA